MLIAQPMIRLQRGAMYHFVPFCLTKTSIITEILLGLKFWLVPAQTLMLTPDAAVARTRIISHIDF